MRKPLENIKEDILLKTLELLKVHEPYEIGLRDIARECNVSATTVMNYYQNKESLFRCTSLFNLEKLKGYMLDKASAESNPVERLKICLGAFRDWCFENPQYALLFMGKVTVDENAAESEILPYYECNRMGEGILKECVQQNFLYSDDLVMDTNIAVYGLWGCIESIIQKRADVELWNKRKEYTDRFINMFIKSMKQ